MTEDFDNLCPDQDTLAGFLAGRLNADDIETIGEHLAACADCTVRLAEIESEHPPLPELPATVAGFLNDGVCDALLSRLDGNGRTPGRRSDPVLTAHGRFEVRESLGTGATAAVYLAFDPLTRREVALKVPHLHILASERHRQRFVREAHTLAKLHHPAIVPVFEAGDDNEQCFLVCEYCGGGTLRSFLTGRVAGIDPASAAATVAQLADAVQHSHRTGVVHRDIKPGNILLATPNPPIHELVHHVKLGDFGLAGLTEAAGDTTSEGAVMGTFRYMSPEQVEGRSDEIDERTDVFGLGVVLYELLTLETPFGAATTAQMIERICHRAPSQAPLKQARVPADLQAICLRCLEKEPGRRYLSAADLRDDLRRFLDGQPTVARPLSSVEQLVRWAGRNSSTAMLLCTTMIALVGVAVISVVSARQSERHASELSDALGVVSAEEARANTASAQATAAQRLAEERLLNARRTAYFSDMRFAFRQFKEGLLVDVRTLLDAQQPPEGLSDLRGLEWNLLNAQVESRMRTIGRHYGEVGDFDFFPDGRVATSGDDGAIRIWDVDSGELHQEFQIQEAPLYSVGISPDGKWIAYGPGSRLDGRGKTVAIMDAESGDELATLNVHDTTIREIRFSENGSCLASGSIFEKVCVWQFADGLSGEMLELIPDDAGIGGLKGEMQFADSGRQLVTIAVGDRACQWWDCQTGALVQELAEPDGRKIDAFTWDEKHELLAYLTPDGEYWDLAIADSEGKIVGRYNASEFGEIVTCLTFSPSGDLLHVGSESGRVYIFEMHDVLDESGQRTLRLSPRESPQVHSGKVIRIRPYGEGRVVSSAVDGRVVMVDTGESSRAPFELPEQRGFTQIDLFHQGDLLAGCDSQCILRVVDRTTGSPHAEFDLRTKACKVAWSGDGKHVAAVGWKGHLWCFRFEDGQLISQLTDEVEKPANETSRIGLTLNHDGSRLYVMNTHESRLPPDQFVHRVPCVEVWDVQQQEPIQSLQTEFSVTSIELSPDEQLIVAGYSGGFAVWDAETYERVAMAPTGGEVSDMVITPDGDFLVVGTMDGVVRLWELRTGTLVNVLPEYNRDDRMVDGLVFSPDGRTLIAGDTGGRMRFWNTEKWDYCGAVRLFSGTNDRVRAIVPAPDGSALDVLVGHGLMQRRLERVPLRVE